MKHPKFSFLTLVTAILLVAGPVHAEPQKPGAKTTVSNEGIAAVVNDDAITMSDVVERMKLIIVSSGMPNNPDMQQRLKGQVINMLIDESLQMQEAKQLSIKVTPEDIEGGFATIAKNNNIEVAKFKATLIHDGISLHTLEKQISAQIAWGKVVLRKVRPQIEVTETDIDARQKFLQSSIGKTQYAVAEIYLPVDSQTQDAEVQALAQKLLNEMTKNHAPFPQVAVQFSQEAASARGGDLGWVQEGQLPDEINQAIMTMKEGDISQPIRSLTGYHIILLRGKRTVTAENIPNRDAILEQIGNERLDRQQRRYLMDLKTAAFIDHRV